MIGEKILHYEILEKLGKGGMGVVYKAHDNKLKRDVAIKFLPQNFATNDEECKRFRIEAQAAAALNHPNITQIYSIEETDSDMFIAMEYVRGQEVKSIIEANDSDFQNITVVIDYAVQIASGLQAAHEKGIVHRDIKPSNIMIADKNQIKIMDFGLAKLGGRSDLTKMGSTLGTTTYMSPE
jgi:serine/threonine protein kinase